MHIRRGDKVALHKAGSAGDDLESFNRNLSDYMSTAQKLAKRSGPAHGDVNAAKDTLMHMYMHMHMHLQHTCARLRDKISANDNGQNVSANPLCRV